MLFTEKKICPECNSKMEKIEKDWVKIDKCTNSKCFWVFLNFWEIKEILEKENFFDKVILNRENISKWDFKKNNVWNKIVCLNCSWLMQGRKYLYGSWININFCVNCWSIYLGSLELLEIKKYFITRKNHKKNKEALEKINKNLWKINLEQKNALNNMNISDKKNVIWYTINFLSKTFF